MTQGRMGTTPLHQQIEMQQEMMVAGHLESGKPIEEYKNPWSKTIFDEIWVSSRNLMANQAKVDPNRKRWLESILNDIQGHFRTYQTYHKQTGAASAEVSTWSIDTYLDVMESFDIVIRIKPPDEKWGEIWFKCSCKYCHVHACCGESLLFSMILNRTLKLPPNLKWSRLEPSHRKRRGRPIDKRPEEVEAGGKTEGSRWGDRRPPFSTGRQG